MSIAILDPPAENPALARAQPCPCQAASARARPRAAARKSMAARGSLLALACVLLAACGPGERAEDQPPPLKDTAFGDMAGTLDKARGVEDTALQHKEAIDRALERDERTGEP